MATPSITTPRLPDPPQEYASNYFNSLLRIIGFYFDDVTLRLNATQLFQVSAVTLISFTGNDTGSSGQTFTSVALSGSGGASIVLVAVNGNPLLNTQYSISGNTLTISVAIAANADIKVQFTYL